MESPALDKVLTSPSVDSYMLTLWPICWSHDQPIDLSTNTPTNRICYSWLLVWLMFLTDSLVNSPLCTAFLVLC